MTLPEIPPRPKPRLREWLLQSSLRDMFSSAGHSRDFDGSRAEYIYLRVRLLSFAFALLALLWIPIDFAYLNAREFWIFLTLRVGFSAAFLALGWLAARPHSLGMARLRLAAVLVIPALFYLFSRKALGGGMPDSGVLIGYSFLPYVMVSLTAIFPLTLVEGILGAAIVLLLIVGTEFTYGTLLAIPTLGEVWLLLLLAGIAIWAQLSQLHMLLRLYREATRDALTGTVNRRLLFRWLEIEVARAEKGGGRVSVLLFDLDLFKRINDSHGHLAGDSVLQCFGQILSRDAGSALVGRYGGEEFLAILPGGGEQHALAVAEQVRAATSSTVVTSPEGGEVRFTVSVGVAEWRRGESPHDLLARVDRSLYRAKEGGRDRVVTAA